MQKLRLLDAIKTIYFYWFKVSAILISVVAIVTIMSSRNNPNAHPVDLELFLGLFLAVVIMTVLLGGIFHLHASLYKPWRQKKLLYKKGMVSLEKLGFKIDTENLCYHGYIDNFYLTLNPITTPQSGEWIDANAFIYLKPNQTDNLEKLADNYKLNFEEEVFWLTTTINIRFNKEPEILKIKTQLEEFVNEIRNHDIEPMKVINTTDNR